MKFRRRKKAEMTLKEIIELVIVALVLVVLIAVPWKLISIFKSDKNQATINNFNGLAAKIENMEFDKDDLYSAYFNKGYWVVSFESNLQAASPQNAISPPKDCVNGCFCLCKGYSTACGQPVCAKFNEKIMFKQPVAIKGNDEILTFKISKTHGNGNDVIVTLTQSNPGTDKSSS
jgi:hypothetical protein